VKSETEMRCEKRERNGGWKETDEERGRRTKESKREPVILS
jgi:hypothetical protein